MPMPFQERLHRQRSIIGDALQPILQSQRNLDGNLIMIVSEEKNKVFRTFTIDYIETQSF
jgi:hypothetical protein